MGAELAHREAAPPDGTAQLLEVPQVQRRMNVGRSTVYGLIASGDLRSVKIGKRRLIPVDAVDDLIRRRIEQGP